MNNGASAWVRRVDEAELRGYAEEKQESCVGMQSRRRRTAWVHSATEVQVCTPSKSTRRDSIYECVASVAIRGTIVSLGAYLQ